MKMLPKGREEAQFPHMKMLPNHGGLSFLLITPQRSSPERLPAPGPTLAAHATPRVGRRCVGAMPGDWFARRASGAAAVPSPRAPQSPPAVDRASAPGPNGVGVVWFSPECQDR